MVSPCIIRTYGLNAKSARFILTFTEKYDIIYLTIEKQITKDYKMYKMNLKNLYGTFLQNGNSPEAFIANIIYERYGAKRKKMLQGLYNIVNGGPTHYWGKCNAEFIAWSMTEISVSPVSQYVPAKNVNIHNLEYYA